MIHRELNASLLSCRLLKRQIGTLPQTNGDVLALPPARGSVSLARCVQRLKMDMQRSPQLKVTTRDPLDSLAVGLQQQEGRPQRRPEHMHDDVPETT